MRILEIKELNFAYNDELVLKNISLNYDSKDFLAIIGPNGGGKSTLVRLILGLIKSQSVKLNLPKSKIGYVPQGGANNENFPICVMELVLMGLLGGAKFGFYRKSEKARALAALKSVGLAEFADKKLGELSGGQLQKAFIARALVSECELLILDEPTASLDSKAAVQIFELLAILHARGVGVIVICHDINLVLAYANKVAHLNKELTMHENDKAKSALISHLNHHHQHFCEVEMSGDVCERCAFRGKME